MRKYTVELVDSETGKIVLVFKGNVVKKKQTSGRVRGDVKEQLFVKDYHINIVKINKSIYKNKKNLRKT